MARFEARTSAEAGRTVVALTGECDLAVSEQLTSVLLGALRDAAVVVVDLSRLTFLDSSGVHGLVVAHHAARDRGARLYAVAPTGMVATVLDVTGVGDLLSPPAGADRG